MRYDWILFIGFFLLIVGVLSGCTQQSPPLSNPNTITIQNYTFSPSILTVSVGTNVTWKNEDSVSHTVISDTGLFESGSLDNGQTFGYRFNTSGTYDYHCSAHPSMTGKIIAE